MSTAKSAPNMHMHAAARGLPQRTSSRAMHRPGPGPSPGPPRGPPGAGMSAMGRAQALEDLKNSRPPPPSVTRAPALVNGLRVTANLTLRSSRVLEVVPFASRRMFHRMLITAALNGHSETVQLLVEVLSQMMRGVSSRPLFFNHAFAAATRNGHLDTARLLLLPMRVAEGTRNQCIQVAAERGNAQVVEMLLDHAARGAVRRALHTAAAHGHEHAMDVLMASAAVNDADRQRARAAMQAHREAMVQREKDGEAWVSDDEEEGEDDIMATRERAAELISKAQFGDGGGKRAAPRATGAGFDQERGGKGGRGRGMAAVAGPSVATSVAPPSPSGVPFYAAMQSPYMGQGRPTFGFPLPPTDAPPSQTVLRPAALGPPPGRR